MISEKMNVALSLIAADARWGEKSLLSSNNQSITIHLTGDDELMLIQRAAHIIDAQGIRHVVLSGDGWNLERSWAFWQGYRAPKGERSVDWPHLSEDDRIELKHRLNIIDWVRDLINKPAEDLGPEQLVHYTVDMINKYAIDMINYYLIKGEDLYKQDYMGLYTVGRGSTRSPVLLVLDYNPIDDKKTPVYACLVGKGITFDTGGYNLKSGVFMDSMKSDMGGAATIAGALCLAIARGLKKRVKLYLCCADNMVSGNSFRLGDIIRYRNGKTVEVVNTDAEGRLVLADGLIDADKQKPKLLIDAATLTGAAKTALGNDYHAFFTFDDQLSNQLLNSAISENESFWRLPLAEFHRRQLLSNFADINNICCAEHTAGASIAAAFLSYFISNYKHGWLHIDCSASYRKNAVEQWQVGATGLGVRTIANLLLHMN